MSVTKAVIPAAGLGTRFLPATKATPKEMLPVVDKPAIQYVVEEAAAAGLTDVLLVTGRNKRPLEDHFDRNAELESALEAKGDGDRLAAVQASNDLARVHYVRQGDPLGLGHAVLQAEAHVGDEPFAVLLGDDLIDPRDPLLATHDRRPRAARRQRGRAAGGPAGADPPVRLRRGPADAPTRTEPTPTSSRSPTWSRSRPREEAPSNLAIIGRYVLDPSVFAAIAATPPGRGGEIQLTDALRTLAAAAPSSGGGVRGVVFRGRRYDTGDRLDYLKAVVRLAAERPDLGPDFLAWLRAWVDDADGGGSAA